MSALRLVLWLQSKWITRKQNSSQQQEIMLQQWKVTQTCHLSRRKTSQSTVLVTCKDKKIRRREYTIILKAKDNEIRALTNYKMRIRKVAKPLKLQLFMHCHLHASIKVLKIDSLHHSNCLTWRHLQAKKEAMQLQKIIMVAFRQLLKMATIFSMETQRGTTQGLSAISNQVLVLWRVRPTTSRCCHSKSRSELRWLACHDRHQMVEVLPSQAMAIGPQSLRDGLRRSTSLSSECQVSKLQTSMNKIKPSRILPLNFPPLVNPSKSPCMLTQ